jgi:hypothetical protein
MYQQTGMIFNKSMDEFGTLCNAAKQKRSIFERKLKENA